MKYLEWLQHFETGSSDWKLSALELTCLLDGKKVTDIEAGMTMLELAGLALGHLRKEHGNQDLPGWPDGGMPG